MSRVVLASLVVLLLIAGALFYFLDHRHISHVTPTQTPPTAPITPPDLATTHAPIALPKSRPDGGTRAHTILSAAWGSGAGQLGRRRDPESVSEGPMSFLADKSGVIL